MIASSPTSPSDGLPAAAPVNRTLQWVVWSALGLLILGLVAGLVRQQWKASEQRGFAALERYNRVPDFTLTERSGQPFQAASLKGKVWLANFFFTACPGPCLAMNGRLQELQQELDRKKNAGVSIVSFSIAPEMDTPEVLREYAKRFHASDHWFFLTGERSKIYDVAHNVFLLPVMKNDDPAKREPDQGDYIHSTKLALVDREGVVRGYYDSTSPEVIQKVLVDIGNLLREPVGGGNGH